MKRIFLFFIIIFIKSQKIEICEGKETKDTCKHKHPDKANDQCCWISGKYKGEEVGVCLPFKKGKEWNKIEEEIKERGYDGDIKVTCDGKINLFSLGLLFIFVILL